MLPSKLKEDYAVGRAKNGRLILKKRNMKACFTCKILHKTSAKGKFFCGDECLGKYVEAL